MPWMYAINDDGTVNGMKGDSGGMSCFISIQDNEPVFEYNAIPQVGGIMRVGSIYARSYSSQDWWQTSLIEEILDEYEEEGRKCIKFKTRNSIYLWRE